ncbi:MAG: hypothetical protein ACP5IB_10150 [Thermoplasmata archaeon]
MINELRPNMFAFSQGIFNKNGKEKKYKLKVSVILENGEYVEEFEDYSIELEDYEIGFYSTICKLNEDEISKFKESRKFIGRI